MADISTSSQFELTVRVGCRMDYAVSSPVTLLANLKPRIDPGQLIQQEKLVLGNNAPCEEFEDLHGNIIYRVTLLPGVNEILHDAVILVHARPDNHDKGDDVPLAPSEIPPRLLRYTLPSRYCDSDKLLNFAWERFQSVPNGHPRVQAVCDWLHSNIEYRFGAGRPDIAASEVIAQGYGVCRDFAHSAIALCRTFNLPARYVTGHLPDIGYVDPASPMDFHAYFEVYLGGKWFTYDARYNIPRIGRVKLACGLDAVDAAFSTIYGAANLTYFEVWAYQVPRGSVSVGDPIDLSKRLDGSLDIRF